MAQTVAMKDRIAACSPSWLEEAKKGDFGIRAVNSKSSVARGKTATSAEFVKCALESVNYVEEDGTNRRGEGHDRGRQTQPSDPATGRQRVLHSYNPFFERL